MDIMQRYRGCLVGLAVGDALGTTVEFKARGSFSPVTDMVGGGPFGLEPGQWTDDTSMALCLAISLVESGGFEPLDQMSRYRSWFREGYLSCTGHCFDIGTTVVAAIHRFEEDGNPVAGSTHIHSAGNGSIMRLAPVPLYWYPNTEAAERFAAASSLCTHAAPECVDACRLLARIISRAMAGEAKIDVLFDDGEDFADNPRIQAIAQGDYRDKVAEEIRGSGYVVDSLEAALWCFWHGGDFAEAVLRAVNLGDDADTTAAVCGQVAGAYWGLEAIPQRWVEKLSLLETIIGLADRLNRSDR